MTSGNLTTSFYNPEHQRTYPILLLLHVHVRNVRQFAWEKRSSSRGWPTSPFPFLAAWHPRQRRYSLLGGTTSQISRCASFAQHGCAHSQQIHHFRPMLHFISPPSMPLGILANDGILCWQARLHKSVVVPRSPSMDVLIHSKSTTSAPSAAESGVLPPDSVSLLDEEKSILAAIQKSLSLVEAEVFHQGPNCGSTHPNLIFPLPCCLAPLPTMVFSADRHDFTNQSSCPVHPAWTHSFTANPPLPPHPPLSQVFRHLLPFLFLMKKNLSWPPSKNPCLQ
jgi:hypothetical protein